MTVPATNTSLQRTYEILKGAAGNLKGSLTRLNAQMAAQGADFTTILELVIRLTSTKAQYLQYKDTPGLPKHFKDQENNQDLDIVAESGVMIAAIDAALTYLDGAVPQSNLDASLPSTWTENESPISQSFNAGQTAPLRGKLDDVIATIS